MDLNALAQYGLPGIMLAVFIGLYVSSIKKGDSREDRIAAQALAREQAMRAECKEREEKLATRLTFIEDQRSKQTDALLTTCAESTRSFARSLERWVDKTDTGSGKHETR